MPNLALRCLVTGGAGFGGSHLAAALLECGADVTIVDTMPMEMSLAAALGVSHQLDAFQADVCDVPLLADMIRSKRINMVFHLAADPIVAHGLERPTSMLDANVRGTYRLLEACRLAESLPKVVFASSGAYYGVPASDDAITEEQLPGVQTSLYGPSKVASEVLLAGYASAFGLRHVVCRFTNTYGPGDRQFSRLIPHAIQLLDQEASYDFGDRDDGTSKLDLLYVEDVISAYLLAADYLISGGSDKAFNFGTGSLTSVYEVAQAVSRAYDGFERTPSFGGSRRDPLRPHKLLDTERARTVLGWEATIPLEEGIRRTVAWHRQNGI